MLTRALIEAKAALCGFKAVDFAAGPGTRVDVELKDDLSDGKITIGVWPETTEADLFSLFATAAFEVRGRIGQGTASDWMM